MSDPNELSLIMDELQHVHDDIGQVLMAVVVVGSILLFNLPRCKHKESE